MLAIKKVKLVIKKRGVKEIAASVRRDALTKPEITNVAGNVVITRMRKRVNVKENVEIIVVPRPGKQTSAARIRKNNQDNS